MCAVPQQLRAFLDFHKIPYKVVEVNPLTKKEVKWSTYGKARPARLARLRHHALGLRQLDMLLPLLRRCPSSRWTASS